MKSYLWMGMEVIDQQRVLRFTQKPWMTNYTEKNNRITS